METPFFFGMAHGKDSPSLNNFSELHSFATNDKVSFATMKNSEDLANHFHRTLPM